MLRRQRRSTLFPYTTLFRSEEAHEIAEQVEHAICRAVPEIGSVQTHLEPLAETGSGQVVDAAELERSEEHTSELQSRLHLVCRLLLEKKKNTTTASIHALSL